jgi:CubicO group peptidase (beta-lactamase class C family)
MTSGLSASTLRRVAAPGERWAYNTAAYQKLRPVLEAVTGDDIGTITQDWLGDPIGIGADEAVWAPRRGEDPTGAGLWSLEMTARAMARFGLLVQRGGRWDEHEVVPKSWFDEALRPSQEENPDYGYLWWLLGRRSGDEVPDDLVAALGAGDQKIYVCPSRDMVAVRQGRAAGGDFDHDLLTALMAATQA